MKKCIKCFRELPETEFHKNRKSKSGRRGTCKVCACAIQKKWYNENKDRHIKNCLNWIEENQDKVKEYSLNSQIKKKILQCRLARDKYERSKALSKVKYFLYNGEIKQSECCQICNKKDSLEPHHHDYHKVKEVIWVCKDCRDFLLKKMFYDDIQQEQIQIG